MCVRLDYRSKIMRRRGNWRLSRTFPIGTRGPTEMGFWFPHPAIPVQQFLVPSPVPDATHLRSHFSRIFESIFRSIPRKFRHFVIRNSNAAHTRVHNTACIKCTPHSTNLKRTCSMMILIPQFSAQFEACSGHVGHATKA